MFKTFLSFPIVRLSQFQTGQGHWNIMICHAWTLKDNLMFNFHINLLSKVMIVSGCFITPNMSRKCLVPIYKITTLIDIWWVAKISRIAASSHIVVCEYGLRPFWLSPGYSTVTFSEMFSRQMGFFIWKDIFGGGARSNLWRPHFISHSYSDSVDNFSPFCYDSYGWQRTKQTWTPDKMQQSNRNYRGMLP